jgi:YHS domain-containing protein
LALVGIAGTATAGEFFETDGAALQGHDAVAYFVENKPVKGSTEFTATHKGSVFRFASAKNRDAFSQDPDQYAPQFNGFCAWGVTRGYKAATQAESFSIVAGKLYLNYNAEVMAIWSTDKTALIQKGEAEWPRVEKTTKVAR